MNLPWEILTNFDNAKSKTLPKSYGLKKRGWQNLDKATKSRKKVIFKITIFLANKLQSNQPIMVELCFLMGSYLYPLNFGVHLSE